MAVTIKQVAEAAGVSRGTVDRVLHNRGGVRQEVAEHIHEIAARLGYFPNRAGKMLAARKQPVTIGYVLPSVGNAFFEDVKKGIHAAEAEMRDFGLRLKIAEIKGFYPDSHIKAIREMVADGCNALCVTTADTPELRNCIDEVVDSGIPVITINTDLSGTKRLCYVGSDYIKAGGTAAGLLALCHNAMCVKVLVATGSLDVKGHNDRIAGFRDTLEKKNIPYRLLDLYETQDDNEIAYSKTKAMLKEHEDVSCIYAVGAGVEGLCKAVSELPTKRRKNLRVLCFDDFGTIRQYVKKGIIDFVVCQEPAQQGYQSVIKLFNYLLDGSKGKLNNYITKAVIKIKENIERN
ncbi:LacI family DNA-binding transcriptional regulator [Christensenellaceae bacterium OttesenSCG-928-K19]|nr:LacI family DNA-binding transcriptional regulator [Christensenellaceae bacterium OttesenSCG-928-K19]